MNTTYKIVLVAFVFLLIVMFFGPNSSGYRSFMKKGKSMYAKKTESYMLNPADIMCPNCITGSCDQHGNCS